MQYLIGIPLAGIICYFLVIGGVLIWPIINVAAFLKVFNISSAIRKKYGTKFHKIDFNNAISGEDRKRLQDIDKLIKSTEKEINDTTSDKKIDIEKYTKQKESELEHIKKTNNPIIKELEKKSSLAKVNTGYKNFTLEQVEQIIYTLDASSKKGLYRNRKTSNRACKKP